MRHFLDFEKPIAALEGKVEELRHMSSDGSINIADEIGKLQTRIERELKQTKSSAPGKRFRLRGIPSDRGSTPFSRSCSRISRRLPATATMPRTTPLSAAWRAFEVRPSW